MNLDFSKSIPEATWRDLDESGRNDFALAVFNHYRNVGFPHYNLTASERDYEFGKLLDYCRSHGETIVDNRNIRQTMHGLALAWSYFPHHWDVPVGNMKTPAQVFASDELFLAAIKKRMIRGTYLSDSGIRKALKTFSGTQGVSNFRPTAASAIYDYFAEPDSTVWDPSSGYGGRLLGAIVSNNVSTYIGTDPATETFAGLLSIADTFANRTNTTVQLHNMGSERIQLEPNSVDLVFTSPPYFNTERYSDESTQSWQTFPTVELWNEGFLRATIRTAYGALKSGKKMILNVANVKSHPKLVDDTVRIAVEEGFTHVDTFNLLLSSISKGGYKSEPVLVFVKA